MRRALALVLVAACGGGGDPAAPDAAAPPDAPPPLVPGDPINLTEGDPAEDEDPCVLVTHDGTLVVAYFGRVDGNADLYLTTSRDGITWTPRTRMTTAPEDDFYPNLIEDDAGRFHLTWFRAGAAGRTVWYTSTDDLATWDDGRQIVFTFGGYDDWVPTIATTPDGLAIVFSSSTRPADGRHHLYVVTSTDGDVWTGARALDDLNAVGEHDHLAQMARTAAGELTLVWVRCDDTAPIFCFSPGADIYTSTSSDAIAWAAPTPITDDAATDALPGLYRRSDGAWAAAWITTAIGDGTVVDLALGDPYPDGRAVLPLDGYSPRVVATPTADVYLGAWVAGATGAQDVHVVLFER
jgi:hypothetical protein